MSWPMMLVAIGLIGIIFIPGTSRQNDDAHGPMAGWGLAILVFWVGVIWAVIA